MSKKRNLTITEALEIFQQLSENESEISDSGSVISNLISEIDTSDGDLSEDDDEIIDIRKEKKLSSNPLAVGNIMKSKDETSWKVIKVGLTSERRKPQHNVVKEAAGPTSHAKRNIIDGCASSAYRLFIDEPILRHIKYCTVTEAHKQLGTNDWSLTLEELDAFISILYARGIYCAKGIEVDSLWSKTWGPPFFNQTMARNRFREIMRFLRFDLKSTRSHRLETDKFALVSEVWNRFISNCNINYTPGPNITIDEQLFPTKTRCRFTQYMPNKPDKFGIKFWMAVDADAKYLINSFPYLGKDEHRPSNVPLSEYVVLQLMTPYLNKGRNVTTDNFFTSLRLAKLLREKKTSLVGTVNRSRKEVPDFVKKSRTELHETNLLIHDDVTLTIYQGKKTKNVLLLSTLHSNVTIGNDAKKLPESISYYNATKFGVDVLDQMTRKYTVKAASRRWPVQVFYNILDLAAINSWVLYKEVTKTNISRKEYIQQLVEELREKYIFHRQKKIEVESPILENSESPKAKRKRVRCHTSGCENKTVDICCQCKAPTCGKCTKVISRYCCDCTQ